MNKLTQKQQDLLKLVGRTKAHPNFGKPNEALDNLVEQLKMENPNAFLRDFELRDRIFYNEPVSGSIPLKGFLIPKEETMKVSSL